METQIQEKGRITLPKKIRKVLGIREGDTISIEVEGNQVVIKPKHAVSIAETKGIIKGKIALEEIEEALGRDDEVR